MRARNEVSRREWLATTTLAAAGLAPNPFAESAAAQQPPSDGFRSLFDGQTLKGWKAVPRLQIPGGEKWDTLSAEELKPALVEMMNKTEAGRKRISHVGRWEVVDGAIIGGQEPAGSGLGGYLLTEESFVDFELEVDARPDWPIDTGIMFRAHEELGTAGFQLLVDHRPRGMIGGIFGNGIGSFHARTFGVGGDEGDDFKVLNFREAPREDHFDFPDLRYGATFVVFGKAWRTNDWNRFRLRCVGDLPVITTWINDVKIMEMDARTLDTEGYDAELLKRRIGNKGRIGFEVHNNGLRMGRNRWAKGAVSRWRNIRIKTL